VRALLINSTLLVTGLARDCGEHITEEILRIENHAAKIFAQVKFFIVESDSIDNSAAVLSQINKRKSNVQFLSLGKLSTEIPGRINRLRYCRNQYVSFIRQRPTEDKPDFVMVVDYDIKNRALNLSPLRNLILEDWWDGLFINQKGPYYDIYALRKKGWVEDDCFKAYQELALKMPAEEAQKKAIWSQMRRIPLDEELIEVNSAFGGLGVYRRRVFESFDYKLISERDIGESEHVSLHKKIVDSGGRLFIVPDMTNFSYAPHNLAAYDIFRRIDRLLRARILQRFRRKLRKLLA
jgi:hypothetical protein